MSSTENQPVLNVNCPQCGEKSVYASTNPYRPFCSQRCKSIDFGAWASESFRAPAEVLPEDVSFGDPKLH